MTSRLDFADFDLKIKTKSAKSTNDLNEVDEVDEVDEVGEIDEVLARWRVFPAMSRIFCARLDFKKMTIFRKFWPNRA